MVLKFDAEFETVVSPLLAAIAKAPKIPAGDALTRRAAIDAMMTSFAAMRPVVSDVETAKFVTTAHDGAELELRWYSKIGPAGDSSETRSFEPTSAVLYLHGGGMICGSIDIYDSVVKQMVTKSGVPLLTVEYRLAPEHPHPTPVEDCFSALHWFAAHAGELGVDPRRIAVYGDSAGGGLAAGVALMARDRGIHLAKQILVYPMLDDRTPIEEKLMAFLMWTYDDNETGWRALLGSQYRTAAVSPYAAPARATDLAGLAPAYIEVGELDAFRNENIEYARRLSLAGVSVELHVHAGVPHAFEALAPAISVSRRSAADRLRALGSL